MASNKYQRGGPIAITATTTTNLFNPPTLTGGTNISGSATYIIIKHIRVVNTTASAINIATWVGSTGTNASGKEFAFGGTASAGSLTTGVSVPANSYVDSWDVCRMDTSDYLVGGASATGLTMTIEYEIGIA